MTVVLVLGLRYPQSSGRAHKEKEKVMELEAGRVSTGRGGNLRQRRHLNVERDMKPLVAPPIAFLQLHTLT